MPADPAVTDLWPAFARTRDPGLRCQLIEQYLPLVRSAARRLAAHAPAPFDHQDLLGFGVIGLIEAVDRYGPARGVCFPSFALQRVRGQILDALRRQDTVSRVARQRARAIEQAEVELGRLQGGAPSADAVAARLGISLEDYQGRMMTPWAVVSLDSSALPGDDGEPVPVGERLADERAVPPDRACERAELLLARRSALACLTERERLLLRLYYYEEWTFRAIGAALGVSEARASQIHSSVLRRLRAALDEQRLGPAPAARHPAPEERTRPCD